MSLSIYSFLFDLLTKFQQYINIIIVLTNIAAERVKYQSEQHHKHSNKHQSCEYICFEQPTMVSKSFQRD